MGELIIKCRKCHHHVYVTNPTLDKVAEMPEYECPECGEEGYENWVIMGKGSFDEDYGND